MECEDITAIRLSNPAAEFIDNHLNASFHPSLPNPQIKYDPAADTFRPQKAIKQ